MASEICERRGIVDEPIDHFERVFPRLVNDGTWGLNSVR
jgi:hypothetical protein